jgi:hypothetical protein
VPGFKQISMEPSPKRNDIITVNTLLDCTVLHLAKIKKSRVELTQRNIIHVGIFPKPTNIAFT